MIQTNIKAKMGIGRPVYINYHFHEGCDVDKNIEVNIRDKCENQTDEATIQGVKLCSEIVTHMWKNHSTQIMKMHVTFVLDDDDKMWLLDVKKLVEKPRNLPVENLIYIESSESEEEDNSKLYKLREPNTK